MHGLCDRKVGVGPVGKAASTLKSVTPRYGSSHLEIGVGECAVGHFLADSARLNLSQERLQV